MIWVLVELLREGTFCSWVIWRISIHSVSGILISYTLVVPRWLIRVDFLDFALCERVLVKVLIWSLDRLVKMLGWGSRSGLSAIATYHLGVLGLALVLRIQGAMVVWWVTATPRCWWQLLTSMAWLLFLMWATIWDIRTTCMMTWLVRHTVLVRCSVLFSTFRVVVRFTFLMTFLNTWVGAQSVITLSFIRFCHDLTASRM